MSIESDDLDAAVAAGILPKAEADALRAFAAKRKSSIEIAGLEDERFRFMTGFNDFFFAVGIVLLILGVAFFAGIGQGLILPSLLVAGLIWLLSELLVRRMRLVLPGILLSIGFIFFIFDATRTDLLWQHAWSPAQAPGNFFLRLLGFQGTPQMVAVKAAVAAAAGALYYWRFRLPFVLLPIAASLVLFAFSVISIIGGALSESMQTLVSLACGIALFGVAMAFDISDRERVTRRADCAFWLHLLAAPFIVHSLVSMVSPSGELVSNSVTATILIIVVVLTLIAILVDRRALLVSALAYIGAIISYAIAGPDALTSSVAAARAGNPDPSIVFFLTLLILGILVIVLGVGWVTLRRRLIALLPSFLARKLPPVRARV